DLPVNSQARDILVSPSITFFRPRPECPNSSNQRRYMLLARNLGQAAYWESRVSIVTAAVAVKSDSVSVGQRRGFPAFAQASRKLATMTSPVLLALHRYCIAESHATFWWFNIVENRHWEKSGGRNAEHDRMVS